MKRPTLVTTHDCTLPVSAEDVPIWFDTASFPIEPEGRTESCPDDLKSTDFNLPCLYQIGRLPVKKNHLAIRHDNLDFVNENSSLLGRAAIHPMIFLTRYAVLYLGCL